MNGALFQALRTSHFRSYPSQIYMQSSMRCQASPLFRALPRQETLGRRERKPVATDEGARHNQGSGCCINSLKTRT
ncbi:hypothetical protein WG66_005406 [Moniliophthora roreri]|nr:hypothetical protein WG66_005406 [Moniliophthora roreri]